MPVLKIKKSDGTWQEVWGAIGTAVPKLANITVLADAWEGETSPYSQVVACNGVGMNSKLDLQPTPAQLVELQDAEISLMAANENGIVRIFAFNDKPQNNMTMRVLITEVAVV